MCFLELKYGWGLMKSEIELIKDLKRKAKNITILFVEDNDNVRVGTYNILNTFFDSIVTANDGQDGLDLYETGKFDIVITDINMARMNGLEMIREIRKINDKQSIVIISAHQEDSKKQEAKDLGIDDYIIKPIMLKQLVNTFNKIIDEKKL